MIVKELVAKLGLDIDELGFEKGEAVLHKLHLGYVAFGTAALSALAVGAAALAKGTADAASAAGRLAQQTGTDLKTAQELGFAFESSGADAETLAHAMQHLARTGVKDVRGGILALAEQFHKMPDDGTKVKIALEKLGRAGAQLIPGLNKGKEALEELMNEADEFGLVFGTEDVKAAKAFKHEIHILEAAFRGLGYSIGKAVLPLITPLVKGLNTLVKDVRTGVPWVHALALALKTLGFVLGGVLLAALVANIGAIATAVSWYVALGIASTIAATKAAAAWLIAAAPAILLVAAFTALLLILDDVRGYLAGEDSLIGALGPKWDAFLKRFTTPQADDPWWLTMTREWVAQLSQAYELVADIEGTFNKAGKFLGFSGGRDSGHGELATQHEINAKQSQQFGYGLANEGALMISGGKRGAQVQVHAPVTIQIAAGAASAAAIADAVDRKIDDHHKKTLRHAAEGIE